MPILLKSFNKKVRLKLTALLAISTPFFVPNAQAEGKLTVYCSMLNETCEEVLKQFSQKYDIETKFVRHSTGTALGKIKAEKSNPQADVWYGGTLEPHLQAAREGLLASYRSPRQKEIMPKFKKLTDQYGEFTSVIYLMELGIGVNTAKLEKLGVNPPHCFNDLLKPEYKDLVIYPDPRVSGTGYSIISTLVQLWGEEKAFDYLKKLHANVAQYTKSGAATSKLTTGESPIDIGFMNMYVKEQEKGAPILGISTCEGSGYALGASSIIKDTRNLDNAKLFMDWALSKEAQEIAWRNTQSYQLPTNIYAKPSPKVIESSKLKLLDMDFARFGSPTESKHLLEKWVEITKSE
ncbi:hypothetical protein A4G18_09285 [Pasteurellaceae bacterium Pebbles2]|nr:hypothetical protein [Pasteurellaceae bacterium Pebbles2]